MRLLVTVCLSLIVGAAPANAAERVRMDANDLEARLRGQKPVLLERTVVAGDLTLRQGARLEGVDVVFTGEIRGPEAPDNVQPRGDFGMDRAVFHKPVTLANLNLEELTCLECEFKADVDVHSTLTRGMAFRRSSFEGGAVFIAIVTTDLDLTDTRFGKGADFSGAKIKRNFDPNRIRAEEPIVISWKQFGERWGKRARRDAERGEAVRGQIESELRFWKRNFEALDQPKDAQEAKHELVKLTRDLRLEPTTWIPYVLELGNGYGTDPNRPVLIAAFVIPIFFVLYWRIGFKDKETGSTDGAPGKLYALGLSLQTFVPFLKIGIIEDSDWVLRTWRGLTALEGLIGALLFAIAAYSATVLI